MKSPFVRIITRVACLGYWILLTVLLLVPNPADLVGLERVPIFPWGKFGIHLIAFTILSVLVHASRWPKRPWWPLIMFLMLYGILTESMQNFVPHRSPQVIDAVENILGVAAGAGIYWIVLRLASSFVKRDLAATE
jgi:VanZ family protein